MELSQPAGGKTTAALLQDTLDDLQMNASTYCPDGLDGCVPTLAADLDTRWDHRVRALACKDCPALYQVRNHLYDRRKKNVITHTFARIANQVTYITQQYLSISFYFLLSPPNYVIPKKSHGHMCARRP